MDQGIIVDALQSIRKNLSPAQKREMIFIFILLFGASVLEVFGLASLVPILISSSDPAFLLKSKLMAAVYNGLGFRNETYFLLSLVVAIFIFFLIKNLLLSWIFYKQARFSAGVAVKLVGKQYNRFVSLSFPEFQKIGSANVVNSTLNIPGSYVIGIVRPFLLLLSEVLMIFIVLVAIIVFKPVLFLILLVVLAPTTYYTYKALHKQINHIGFRLNELKPLSYRLTSDAFFGYTDLKLAGLHQDFKDKIIDNQQEVQQLEAKGYLYNQLPLRIIEMIALLGIVIIFVYSLLLRQNSSELLTIIGLFAAAAYRLMPSINRLLMSLMDMKRNQFAIRDLDYQETEKPGSALANVSAANAASFNFDHSIELHNINFTFPDAELPVLKNIDLTIKKGEKVGIIGKSGSGKTTLINILLRFYKEQSGQLLVDGKLIPEAAFQSWHNQIGYVKQDVFLLESSILENITLGRTPVDQKRLQHAIEQAFLSNFINQLPAGVHTDIGERGARLSGGQRQRIGIARALYRDCSILILDEATSALDVETEASITESIENLKETDITVVIISHRLSILKNCSKVFTIEHGELASVTP